MAKDSKKIDQSKSQDKSVQDATPDTTPATPAGESADATPATPAGESADATPATPAEVSADATPATPAEVSADATPATPAEVSALEAMRLNLAVLDASIAKAKEALDAAFAARDVNAVTSADADVKRLVEQRDVLANGIAAEAFAPEAAAALALVTAPQGRFTLVALFEGGKLVSVRRQEVSGMTEARSRVNEKAQAAQGKSAPVRANFNVGAVDPRHAPPGWVRVHTHKGSTWQILSLGQGRYRATCGNVVHEDTGNTVLQTIHGHPMNTFDAFNLGKFGVVKQFDTANPPKGWTKG